MIISRTPLRISFAGGGTDLKPYYEIESGAVIGITINKYVYVAVNRQLDNTIKLSYLKTEIVESVEKIEHKITRQTLEMLGLDSHLEIASLSDIPSGTGLGSSGSFTVGLLHALYAYKSKFVSKEQLAREACKVEIELLSAPIGKQDQYLASYGGLNFIQFYNGEYVTIEPVIISEMQRHELEDSLMLFYTGQARDANSILASQHKKTKEATQFILLTKMKEIAQTIYMILREHKDLRELGNLLHEEWLLKKQITEGISNPKIDAYYEKACKAGALGGKITGAGGGGFLLFYCEPDKQQKVRASLHELKEIDFSFDIQGTSIITVS